MVVMVSLEKHFNLFCQEREQLFRRFGYHELVGYRDFRLC